MGVIPALEGQREENRDSGVPSIMYQMYGQPELHETLSDKDRERQNETGEGRYGGAYNL